MADGQIWLPLTYDAPSPDPSPPQLGSVGDELYAAMRPWAFGDPDHGWALAHICEAIGRMWQAVDDLVRVDNAGNPGWSALLDVDRCPGPDDEIDGLPFLGLLAGVRRLDHLDDAARRRAIRERAAFHRGRPASVLRAAAQFTDGAPGAVSLRERYDPDLGSSVDAPHHLQVRVRRSRLLPGVDERDLEAQVRAAAPAGLIVHVAVTDEQDYDDVGSSFADYDDVAARVRDYDELLGGA